jgi:hypothetical protein
VIGFLADEDFNNDWLRALRRRRPGVDAVRVQDVGLSGQPDPAVLAWAAGQGRVLLTHDAATLVGHALARLAAGEPLAGVPVAPQSASPAAVIADLESIDEVSDPADWAERVVFLPLR